MTAPLLAVEGVSRAYAGRRVLADVSFEVAEGESLVLLGRTGSGKTTLLNLLAGLQMPDSGAIRLRGQPITGTGLDRGIVFQGDSLLPWMTAAGNVALAVEAAFPMLDRASRTRRVESALALVRLDNAGHKFPSELSGGMRQRVAIARALAMEPEVLLLDEPFSALDAMTRGELQEEVARIHRVTGRTIVMVTSDLDEALLLADRVMVLGQDGSLSAPLMLPADFERDRDAAGFDNMRDRLWELLETSHEAFRHDRTMDWAAAPVLLEVADVTKRFSAGPPAVEGIGFTLNEGEFVSLVGHSGCGKSTLLAMVAGLLAPSEGTIRIGGELVRGPGADRAMVFQSPALLPWLSVAGNVRLGVDQAYADRPRAEREAIVAAALEQLGLAEMAGVMPRALSAGARQRVGVARAVALQPRLLLLDEPFAGLDTPTRNALQVGIGRFCRETGTSAILVTHDIDEALTLSDRIIMMTDGPRARVGRILDVAGGNVGQLRREMLSFLGETARAVGTAGPAEAQKEMAELDTPS
ncbi:MAG: ABC transporter ATP-binding protein [Paracraurococcus sp.]